MSVAVPSIVRIQDAHDFDQFQAFPGGVLMMTPDVVPVSFAVPAGYTALWPDMSVPDGITVEIAGTLVDVPTSAGVASTFLVVSPYASRTGTYRGNLHCHTTISDGAQAPAVVAQAYRDAGYDFLMISDHSNYAPNVIGADPGVDGLVFIFGTEYSTGPHVQLINVISYTGGVGTQTAIDSAIVAGGLTSLNHLRYQNDYAAGLALAQSLTSYDGIEIWNSVVDYVLADEGNSESIADAMLVAGRQLLLFVGDDTHDIADGLSFATASTYVFANAKTSAAILDELYAGNFYSSNGPVLQAITVEELSADWYVFSITSDDVGTFEFIVDGAVAQSTAGVSHATYRVLASDGYVRARFTRASDGLMAWTNPLYTESVE